MYFEFYHSWFDDVIDCKCLKLCTLFTLLTDAGIIGFLIFSLTSSTSDAIASYSSCASDRHGSTNGILASSADPRILDDTKGLDSSDHCHT